MLPVLFRDEHLVAIPTGRHNRLFRELFGCHRLLLACVELRFDHPVTGAPLTIRAPLAEDFAAVVGALGWAGAAGG